MSKTTLFAYTLLPVAGFGLLGASIASAHGLFGTTLTPDQIATRQQTMFQNEATLLGLSIDDVKSAWAQGKTLQQLATDHGITADQLQQKMKDARAAQLKTKLQTLVDKGIITQAQADQRLQFLQNAAQNMKGGHMGMRGFRGGFGL
jgi:hypothetical protein